MGYYSFKRKETLSQATTQRNPESQILDDPTSDEISKAVKLKEAESRMAAVKGWGEGGSGKGCSMAITWCKSAKVPEICKTALCLQLIILYSWNFVERADLMSCVSFTTIIFKSREQAQDLRWCSFPSSHPFYRFTLPLRKRNTSRTDR